MPVEKQSLETRAEDLENIENETEESLHLLQQEVLQQNENPEYQKYLIPEKEYLTKLQDMLTQS
jgi:predicted metal-dependent hydrolase